MTQAYRYDRQGVSDNEVVVEANMSETNVKRSGRNQHATT